MELLLDGRVIRSERAFHKVIDEAARPGLSGYGYNLDALEEVLAQILPKPLVIRWVNADQSKRAIGSRFEKIMDVMRDLQAEFGADQFQLLIEP